jgi:hypothetical protein
MTSKGILKLLKQLEAMAAFQKDCLDQGNWADYDKADAQIKKIEHKIVSCLTYN